MVDSRTADIQVSAPKRQTLAAFLLSFIFVFSLAFSSGALFSGFQLTEDYQYLDTHERLEKGETWGSILERYFHQDSKRLRLAWPALLLQTEILGTQIHAIRWLHVAMGALSLFFLYLFGRSVGFGFLETSGLGLLCVTGPHSYIWWRMQTHENICLFFLALGLWAAAKDRNIIFIVSIGLMSLFKESFMIIVPAVLFLKVWIVRQRLSLSWTGAFRRNYIPILALFFLVGIQMLLIFFVTGTIAGGYVGYEGLFLDKLMNAAGKLANAAHAEYFLALLIAALFSIRKISKQRKPIFESLDPLLFFFLLLTIPQAVLYQKTGIDGHYVLPGIFAFWFAFFYIFKLLKDKFGFVQKLILFALISHLIAAQTVLAFETGAAFKKEGAMVTGLLNSVKEHTQPGDPILMVVDPGRHLEWSYAAKRYLESFEKRSDLWLMPIIRPNYSAREKYLTYESPLSPLNFYKGRMLWDLPDPKRIQEIVIFPTSEIWFLVGSRAWFNKRNYDRTNIGSLVFYTKKT